MKFCILGSGSKGNSILFDNGSSRILVDIGFSHKDIKGRLASLGVEPESIDGIAITHEHTDHVRGLSLWVKRYGTRVYTTKGTHDGIVDGSGKPFAFDEITSGRKTEIGGFKITPFHLSHDACDPVGMLIESNGVRVGIATDLGCATALVRERLKGLDGLIIEFNHDVKMLMDGPYPWHLKDRIRKNHGHLSNAQAATLLEEIYNDGLGTVALAHLSETNNKPDIALETAKGSIKGRAKVIVAEQSCPGPIISF